MYLLDTDVLSQVPKQTPNERVMEWLAAMNPADLYVSVITIEEIRYGVERLDAGRKRKTIEAWIEQDVLANFAARILPVDLAIADRCGRIVASAKRQKHNPSLQDALIAATAAVHNLQLATLNRHHFEKLPVKLVAL